MGQFVHALTPKKPTIVSRTESCQMIMQHHG